METAVHEWLRIQWRFSTATKFLNCGERGVTLENTDVSVERESCS